jgi:hypothetical protein
MERPLDVFWGEIAPCEHVLQIYEDDDVFLDTLEGFVLEGLQAGETVIAIGTNAHLRALASRLQAAGIDVEEARSADHYIPVDAEEALSRFMVNGWPNEDRFREMIDALLTRARRGGRKVRAFGEMVAVLWAQGHHGATVNLEHLWHRVCHTDMFALFCAYPRIGMTRELTESINEICSTHTQVFDHKYMSSLPNAERTGRVA